MFRKEYIQANDNIKVDEELLEKTLEAAFKGKQKKRVYSYRPMTSVAAAAILVIGCTVAYPKLTDKPAIEDVKPVVTIAPVGDEFLPVETTAPITTKPPKKIVSQTPKPVVEVVVPEQTAKVEEPAPVAEIGNVPSVARFIPEPVVEETLEEQLNLTDGYVLKETSGENYVFENEDGKKFSVNINDTEEFLDEALWEENESGINLTFNKDDKVYSVKSENISKTELNEIFNNLIN